MDEPIGYLADNQDGLWYRSRLAAGQVIGTGLIEGGCKNIIAARLKINNPRWRVRRAERMAALRCVQYSDLWAGVLGCKGRLIAKKTSYTRSICEPPGLDVFRSRRASFSHMKPLESALMMPCHALRSLGLRDKRTFDIGAELRSAAALE